MKNTRRVLFIVFGVIGGAVVLGGLVCCGLFATVWSGVRSLMTTSEPATYALQRMQEVPGGDCVGSPVAFGWAVNGSYNVHNGDHDADMSLPVSGPKGDGSLRVDGTSVGGVWTYDALAITCPDGTVVDLR